MAQGAISGLLPPIACAPHQALPRELSGCHPGHPARDCSLPLFAACSLCLWRTLQPGTEAASPDAADPSPAASESSPAAVGTPAGRGRKADEDPSDHHPGASTPAAAPQSASRKRQSFRRAMSVGHSRARARSRSRNAGQGPVAAGAPPRNAARSGSGLSARPGADGITASRIPLAVSTTPSARVRSRKFGFGADSLASTTGGNPARASTPGGRGAGSDWEGHTSEDTAKFRDLIKQLHTEKRKNKTLSETLAASASGGSGDMSRLEREKAQLETDHAIAYAAVTSQLTQLEAQRGQQARAAEMAVMRAKTAEVALAEAEEATQAALDEAEASKAQASALQAKAEAATAAALEKASASDAEAAAATGRAAEAESAREEEVAARHAAEAATAAAEQKAATAAAQASAAEEELAAAIESSRAAAEQAEAEAAELEATHAAAAAASAARIASLEAALAERTAALEALTTRQMETSADLETAQEAVEDLEAQLERSTAEGQRLAAELQERTETVADLEARLAAETARAASEGERADLAEADASEVRSRFEAVDSRRRSVEEQLLDAKGAVRVFARVRPALDTEKEAEASEASAADSAVAASTASRSKSRTKAGRSGSTGSGRRAGAAGGLKRTGSASSMSSTGSAGSGGSAKAALAAAAAVAGPLFQFPAAEAAGEERTLRVQQLPGAGVGGYGVASEGKKTDFAFQRVFGPQAGQEDVFGELDGLVNSAVDGKRVCIFAYGQTGAGKTHTMLGQTAPTAACEGSGDRVTGDSGVIPRAVTSVFARAATLRDHGWTTDVRAEFLEVYLDDVYDLLARAGIGSAPVPKHTKQGSSGSSDASAATADASSGAPPTAMRTASGSAGSAAGIARKASRGAAGQSSAGGLTPSSADALAIRTAQDGTLRVVGQRALVVESEAAVFELLSAAAAVRSTASTAMNATSSRSHSVFTLRIACAHEESGLARSGVLNLVDLAGSERILRSGAADDVQLKREATAINKSLTVLGSVLRAMGANDQRRSARPRSASGQTSRRPGTGDSSSSTGSGSSALAKSSAGRSGETHVPFRDSTLTRLLQPSLTRGARAAMIVNLNPLHSSASESLCSLRFAEDVAKRCSTST